MQKEATISRFHPLMVQRCISDKLRMDGHAVRTDSKGCIRTLKKLPCKPPESKIPGSVKRLLLRYRSHQKEGSDMTKQQLRDTRMMLRRYHLIEPDQRIRWATKTPEERRQGKRAQKKRWREMLKVKRQAEKSGATRCRTDAGRGWRV